jgi:hypothetical protein
MPHRIPTPPPADDELRYISVVNPWPRLGNFDRDQHRKECAWWISAYIGPHNLIDIYHKPTVCVFLHISQLKSKGVIQSPETVILEIRRDCADVVKLIGAHKWREMFKKLADDLSPEHESAFYWCIYGSNREVTKNGTPSPVFISQA